VGKFINPFLLFLSILVSSIFDEFLLNKIKEKRIRKHCSFYHYHDYDPEPYICFDIDAPTKLKVMISFPRDYLHSQGFWSK
jgi:hypothetical protein